MTAFDHPHEFDPPAREAALGVVALAATLLLLACWRLVGAPGLEPGTR